jgi:predicted metal-dependent phosphoesterase TrpH
VKIQSQFRIERAERIAAKLEKCGISGALQVALDKAAGGNICRPHFAQFLVETGHCKSTDDAFKQYLSENKPAYVKQVWSSLEDIISWICDAGGKAMLAHPNKYNMTRSKLVRLLKQMKAYGGHGLEVLCARQAPHITQNLAKIAIELDMLVSIGSDFHSPTQTWLRLGMHEFAPSGCRAVWDEFKAG